MPADRTQDESFADADPVRIIGDSPLLRSADRASLEDLRPVLEWVPLDEDDVLSLGGGDDNGLYFVAEGRLEISILAPDQDGSTESAPVVAGITVGDVVGETQTLTGARRRMTIRATTAARLVRLSKEGFDQYLITHPDVTAKLKDVFTPRFYRRQMLLVLNDMFGELTPVMLAEIQRVLTWRHVAREGVVIRRGESSDRQSVVVSGRLRLLSPGEGEHATAVEEIAQGGTVGQLGLFSDREQPTTVVAARDSVLLEFRHEDFRHLADRYPRLNEWLAKLLSERLQGVIRGTAAEEASTNILLIPAGPGPPLEDFARRFLAALRRETRCLFLSSPYVDRSLGSEGISQAVDGSPEDLRLRVWLDGQEAGCRYVVYLADEEVTNWTRRCVRQAEEVIAVGAATASPALRDVELSVLLRERERRVRTRRALVLIHPPGTHQPRGTAAWLRDRQVDRHFHMRSRDEADVSRLVRYVLQRETGLVLSGGGARGFAHAGILRAVRETGLSVDVIGGTSMGAVVGGRYAFAGDPGDLVPVLKAQMMRAFRDYTLPVVSLTRGRRFDRGLRKLFADTNIEDLWTPFFCISSNMTRAETVVHQSGTLWRAVRASGGLPGLVPPVIDDGDLLFDGCLTNNLPIDEMRQHIRGGLLIAVDVVPPVDLDVHAGGRQSWSGWRLAMGRLNPFGTSVDMPGIVSILQRAGQLPSLQTRKERIDADIADLYLKPPVQQFKILDFDVVEEAAEIGYSYGRAELQRWSDSREPVTTVAS